MAKQHASANVGIVQTKSAPAATPKPAAASPAAANAKLQMIAEAAYYIAEKRGFQGGDAVQDWLTAEAQIEQLIKKRH